MEVSDCTGRASLICWDRECEQLLDGKSCYKLKCELEGLEGVDIPNEISSLVDRTSLFKVQVKANQVSDYFGSYSGSYSVSRLTADDSLVSKYNALIIEIEESDFLAKLQREMDGGYESDEEVNTPLKPRIVKEEIGEGTSTRRALFEDVSSSSRPKKLMKIDHEANQCKEDLFGDGDCESKLDLAD